jgi:hypothetical protein
MANFLVSNVVGRNHTKIYGELAKGAFFDLTPSQSGWEEFSRICEGDTVYVINESRKIAVGYKVNKVVKGVLLADDPAWGSRVESETGGTTGVLFGTVCERVDMAYSKFVKERNIRSTKLDPKTGQMYQGFNCAEF